MILAEPDFYGPDDGHELIFEEGIVSCSCGGWWVKGTDRCSTFEPHFKLWEAWSMGRFMDEVPAEENLELMRALDDAFGPATTPSVWDINHTKD